MPLALNHGNPETPAIWGPLLGALRRDDAVPLSPPGFGSPVPPGFEPTAVAYRQWLINELEVLDGPVDVLAHDWGAGHLFGVIDERPDMIRSWVSDCAGLLHCDYEWHEAAQVWQTPGAGEDLVAAMAAGGALGWEALGMTPTAAREVAEALHGPMADCIPSLYRSAVQPALRELGARLADADVPPGLVLIPTEDHYAGTPAMAREVAADLGARTVDLDGQGHWWMMEDPVPAAAAIADFLD